MNPYSNIPERARRIAERADTMRRHAERTWKSALRAAGIETARGVRREYDAHRALGGAK
jgi:hypothetical protein